MDDERDVEEIVERIRRRADAARRQGQPGFTPKRGTTPLGQRVRRVWQLLNWYSQHPEEFHIAATSRVVTARSIDDLYETVRRLQAQLAEMQEVIARLRAETGRTT